MANDFIFLVPDGGSFTDATGVTITKNRLPEPGIAYTYNSNECGLGTFKGDIKIAACGGFTGKLTCDGDIKTFSNVDIDGTLNVDNSTRLNSSLSVVGISTLGNTVITGVSTFGLSSSTNPVSNSQMSFELTSNTSLTIKVRGTDGTIRTAVIGLTI